MAKEYKSDSKPPSELFVNSIQNGCGSPDMECGWCGRMHLCPKSESYTGDADGGKGWEEDCVKQYRENSEGVILHWEYDAVTGHMLNSINFVDDCPCNGLTRYETFIWAERNSIRHYLRSRIELEYNLAEQEKTLNELAGITDKVDKTEKFWRGY